MQPTTQLRSTLNWIFSVWNRNIGRCPHCMKTAFLSALASWSIYFPVLMLSPGTHLPLISLWLSIGLTGLWLAHATTYGTRVLLALRKEYLGPASIGSVDADYGSLQTVATRRTLLGLVGTAASMTAMAALWMPAVALAAGHKCGKGHCPDDAPKCCSHSLGKCCNGNWACVHLGKCFQTHSAARRACGKGRIWSCF